MTPIVQDGTLVYQHGGHEQTLAIGTAAWYSWLETASTFAFVSERGTFTARREQSGHKRGGWYWKAYRKWHGKLSSHYLGKSEALTLERLQAAAQALADALVGTLPVNDANAAIPEASAAQRAHGDPLNPLLATKLHAPRPRAQLVSRPELIERLQEGIQGPLTLVSAPAGFGKTTLLAQWLVQSDTPVAWLSLEPEDNEPVRFLSYVIAALQTLDSHIGTTALALLQMSQPALPETVVALLTNDLVIHDRGDFALVLEDYHVIEASPIHRSLAFLLEHLPPQMHLLLTTRADPPLPLARLRARGQLTELRAAELRFRAAEASAFLEEVMGLHLSASDVATLQTRTEGWIAGLQLAALSLQGRATVSAFLPAFTGSHHFVLDYLSEEVLSRQPPAVQTFLLQTSMLERLSGSLCDAVTGQQESQAMLEALERANLFVAALDDERRWYRYHHLFADVLRSRLQQEEPALLPELHRRASAWYEQYGVIDEAVQYRLNALDWEEATRLIEQHGERMALGGHISTILRWLERLPVEVVRARPRLCILQAMVLIVTSDLEATAARVSDVEQAIQEHLPAEQLRALQGRIAILQSDLALAVGDRARCVALANQALQVLPETDLFYPTLRQAAATAFRLTGEVIPGQEVAIEAMIEPARAAGNLFTLLYCFTALARLHMLRGQLHQAGVTLERAAQVLPKQEGQPILVSSPVYYFALGELLYEGNHLDEAEQALAQGMEVLRGPLQVDAHVVTEGYTTLARVQQAQGDLSTARATLEALALLARQRHYVRPVVVQGAALQAQMALRQGNLPAAIHWADTSDLTTDDEPNYLYEQAHLTLARVRIAQGRNDPSSPLLLEGMRLLDRFLADAEAKARLRSALEMLLLQALALDAYGDRKHALARLERALALAESEGYIRLFVDEGAPMLTLLRQIHPHTHGSVQLYVATLLSAFGEPAMSVPSRAFPLVEPLTERELDVLRLLVAGLSNPTIAQELVITVGTVKRHVNSIYGKLGVTSRSQAVARAYALHAL
jgi:LuxR family transcriptional regulator, maltose regulon positive regulatory protein